jgi:hypothetical protein
MTIFLDWFVAMGQRELSVVRGELDSLAEAVFRPEHGQKPDVLPFLLRYVQEKLDAGAAENALCAARYVPCKIEHSDLLLRVASLVKQEKGAEAAGNFLLHSAMSGSEYLRLGDEDPPALIARKATLEAMMAQSEPGALRSILRDCSEQLVKASRAFSGHDEDLLNPRA